MRRFMFVFSAILTVGTTVAPSSGHRAIAAMRTPASFDLSPLLPAPSHPGLVSRSISSASSVLGYNIVRKAQYCPNLPDGTQCNNFSPDSFWTLTYFHNAFYNGGQISGPGGRIGKPTELQLQCIHYHTANGVTTAQAGVAVYDGIQLGWTVTPASIAGILSPDTPTTWSTDRHSASFAHIQGTYVTNTVRTEYTISGFDVRDNLDGTPVFGGLTTIVSGTLIDAAYDGTKFYVTGYSQGEISCFAGVLQSPGGGQYSWGYNQVFSMPTG